MIALTTAAFLAVAFLVGSTDKPLTGEDALLVLVVALGVAGLSDLYERWSAGGRGD